jgi:hypothetical protein
MHDTHPGLQTDRQLIDLIASRVKARGGILRAVKVIWDGDDGIAREELLSPIGPTQHRIFGVTAEPLPFAGYSAPDQVVPPAPAPPAPPKLTEMEEGIMNTLAACDKPLKQLAIAHRMGRDHVSSHMKKCFVRLRRVGQVQKIPGGGFWRCDRELKRQVR